MENSSTQTAANPQNSDQNKQDVLKDIRAKWSKFTELSRASLISCLRSQPSMALTRHKPSVRSMPC